MPTIDNSGRRLRRQGWRGRLAEISVEMSFLRGTGPWLQFLARLAKSLLTVSVRKLRRTRRLAPPNGSLRPRSPLSIELAVVGPCAEAVFRASDQVHRGSPTTPVDVVVADGREEAEGVAQPVVVLTDNPRLAVPALDPNIHNPIGWSGRVRDHVAALGPLGELPLGVEAHDFVRSTDLRRIRHCHHVVDVRAFHTGPVARAGTLVRLLATGAPIRVADEDRELEALLGKELYRLLTGDMQNADAVERELRSIATRRIALRDHTISARARQMSAATGGAADVPEVSVLLATKRSGFLHRSLANVARQNYPRLELILALHGGGFDDSEVALALEGLDCAVEVLRIPERVPFGVVVGEASAAAGGTLLTKMDDDDAYDNDHVWDLVLAHEYSGAHVVGKGAETIYLSARDQTVECNRAGAETYSRNVAGGTLLLARRDLESLGGWRPVRRHVDKALIDDVVGSGGVVYRTHGRGYVLVRHGEDHTWTVEDEHFLEGARAVRHGRPGLADGARKPGRRTGFDEESVSLAASEQSAGDTANAGSD